MQTTFLSEPFDLDTHPEEHYNYNYSFLCFLTAGYYIWTKQSTQLTTSVSKGMSNKYQCMSLWYKYEKSTGMEFFFIQTLEGYENRHNFNVSHREKTWRFAEISLQQNVTAYSVKFEITLLSIHPFVVPCFWHSIPFYPIHPFTRTNHFNQPTIHFNQPTNHLKQPINHLNQPTNQPTNQPAN